PDRIAGPLIASRYRPGARQGVVEREIALLERRLIVGVKGQTAPVIGMGASHETRLDLERIEASVAILVDPLADGVAEKIRLLILGPVAPIGEDAARRRGVEQDVGGIRADDDLHRENRVHHARHADREAAVERIITLAAVRLIRHAGLPYGLVFG